MGIKRLTSAILGFPLVILILVLGNNYIIDIAFFIIALLTLDEFYNSFKEEKPVKWIGYLCALPIATISFIKEEWIIYILGLGIPFVILLLFLQVIISNMKVNIKDISVTLLGIIYIVGFIIFLPIVRNMENGGLLIWYLIITSWGTDTFAYVVGKKFGRNKFCQISPNKTLEGSIGGIVGSTILILIYTVVLNNVFALSYSYLHIIIITIILSIISQIGDLVASSIKRYSKTKDFSNLIPGHGGLLDRIDSLIFIAPIGYFIFLII